MHTMTSSKLIKDPFFQIQIDRNASSYAPDKGIWNAQHVCVSEDFALDAKMPANPADAVIRHELKRKHWSVLDFGYVVIHFAGFPHDTVMQLVRHQDSKPLVQSMRYTGQRVLDVVNGTRDVREVFYHQPVGSYPTRTGRYEIALSDIRSYYEFARESCVRYHTQVRNGIPEEVARRSLVSGYRQNFVMAGSIRAVFHWLDQRTLADSQLEAQTLAWMALAELKIWQPEFFKFYEQERAGKNLLAP